MSGDAGSARAALTYVGHATVLIDIDGVRMLTDPILRRRVAHLRRHGGVDPHVLRGVDAVLVSHAHMDHLDFPSLERLGRDMPVVVPKGAGPMLRRHRFTHVTEVAVGERFAIGGLEVEATYADHERKRLPFGREVEPVGFVVSGSRRVYFAGDTDLFDGMTAIGEGGLDAALLPVWGWGPNLGPGHLDPERAAQAAAMLRPRTAVPIHWGTLSPLRPGGAPVPSEEPPQRFLHALADAAPQVRGVLLAPGETLTLEPAAPSAT
jgi:L-ascorbate metabolism protein UlaG (beta-lactamase superfamily)